MSQLPQEKMRGAIALAAGIALCLLCITPFALAINHFDWGVGLLVVAPLWIWFILRLWKALECWARNESSTLPPDPDFPDDPE